MSNQQEVQVVFEKQDRKEMEWELKVSEPEVISLLESSKPEVTSSLESSEPEVTYQLKSPESGVTYPGPAELTLIVKQAAILRRRCKVDRLPELIVLDEEEKENNRERQPKRTS